MATILKYAPSAKSAPQFVRGSVRPDKAECISLYAHVFAKGCLKRFGAFRFTVSRWKGGTENPSERMMRLGREMQKAGYTLNEVLMLSAHLEAFYRSLFVVQATKQDVTRVLLEEAEHEGTENPAQMRAAIDPTPENVDHAYIECIKGAAHDNHSAAVLGAFRRSL